MATQYYWCRKCGALQHPSTVYREDDGTYYHYVIELVDGRSIIHGNLLKED